MAEDLLSPLKDIVLSAAVEFGVPRHLAEDLAAKIEDKLRIAAGGGRGYVAKIDREERNRRILDELRRDDYRTVAMRHNLTERHVRRIEEEGR